MLAHWNKSLWIYMSSYSDTLSWFRANQYLLFLLNTACLAEKRQIPILYFLVWPDPCSNPRSTALEKNTLTITIPMWFVEKEAKSISLSHIYMTAHIPVNKDGSYYNLRQSLNLHLMALFTALFTYWQINIGTMYAWYNILGIVLN